MKDLTIQIKAVDVFTFNTFGQWGKKAASLLLRYSISDFNIVCIDKEGYSCHMSADFMASRDAGRFPVTAYIIPKSSGV